MAIQVVIADDFPIMREAMATALSADPAIEVVAEAENGLQALALADRLEPDVVVLDLRMQRLGGQEVLEQLRRTKPQIRVVVVTAVERPEALHAALAGGAAGYLSKRCSGEELRRAVISVHGGGSYIVVPAARTPAPAPAPSVDGVLAPRERRIVGLVAAGCTDAEIGAELRISGRMVRNHLVKVQGKIGIRRRAELIRWAVEHGVG